MDNNKKSTLISVEELRAEAARTTKLADAIEAYDGIEGLMDKVSILLVLSGAAKTVPYEPASNEQEVDTIHPAPEDNTNQLVPPAPNPRVFPHYTGTVKGKSTNSYRLGVKRELLVTINKITPLLIGSRMEVLFTQNGLVDAVYRGHSKFPKRSIVDGFGALIRNRLIEAVDTRRSASQRYKLTDQGELQTRFFVENPDLVKYMPLYHPTKKAISDVTQ